MVWKIVAKMPLSTILLFLEQLASLVGGFEAKIYVQRREIGCRCNMRTVKTIKKTLSNCCPYLFDEQATVEAVVASNDNIDEVLQAFNAKSLGYVVTVH